VNRGMTSAILLYEARIAAYLERIEELEARNAELEAALRKCVSVFDELAIEGHYPKPLMGSGGWTFAIDALAGRKR
jgi:hypothetical protein